MSQMWKGKKMRAILITIGVLAGICLFVTGCGEDKSANQFNWGQDEKIAEQYDYEYEYDCYEDEYYSDAGEWDDEYQHRRVISKSFH